MNNSSIYKIDTINYKTLILLDWDDTLFPTSWIIRNSIDLTKPDIQNKYIVFFAKLDLLLSKLLNNFLKFGQIVIVTNALLKWIDISANIIPNTNSLIKNKVLVVSARDIYQQEYPGDGFLWKKLVFKKIVDKYYAAQDEHDHGCQNILSVGDAEYEFRALTDLYDAGMDRIKKRQLKAIKFMPKPSYDLLIDQLEVLDRTVTRIVNSNQNLDLLYRDI